MSANEPNTDIHVPGKSAPMEFHFFLSDSLSCKVLCVIKEIVCITTSVGKMIYFILFLLLSAN